ncbi:MAG: DUF4834 domain-containing protein [Sphingobacteriaceae bacterium]
MEVLRFLFYLFLIFWLLRIIARIALPLLFKRMLSNMQKRADQAQGGRPKQPEGSIHVDFVPQKDKKPKKDSAGEFVDFEEID